ncbi:MAG: hypothetical protein ACM3JD_14165, partial [Rudaea sp.]
MEREVAKPHRGSAVLRNGLSAGIAYRLILAHSLLALCGCATRLMTRLAAECFIRLRSWLIS